jgi:predicted nucleic acid-binding protein
MRTSINNTRIFIDTNILFYANNSESEFGTQSIQRMNELLTNNNQLLISSQVIREFSNVGIREARRSGLAMPDAIATILNNIAIFERNFEILFDSHEVMATWKQLILTLRTQKDIFDYNIVATMKANNISHILTHNTSDFIQFTDIQVIPLFDE